MPEVKSPKRNSAGSSSILNGENMTLNNFSVDMTERSTQKTIKRIFFSVWPALAVLFLSLIIASFFAQFTFVAGLESVWKILLRFLRFLLILILPLPLLPRACGIMQHLLNRRRLRLIQIREERHQTLNLWQNWLIRPFQGIGLSMLIATKLIALLQISATSPLDSSIILPPAQFNSGRFVTATVIAIMTSILLSFFWSLDDLGIRHHNERTGEVKMIGKYIGVLLPILFGFYGMFSLFKSHEHLLAIQYIAQMAVVLYPPFLVMTVFHALYIEKYEILILKKLKVAPQNVRIEDQERHLTDH
ncbi:MAG: hypothetical protein NTV58_07590 [Deltaproteobacteria bacterium]|nr:hypothetical protein [Deltaproteobacteria bacterium]